MSDAPLMWNAEEKLARYEAAIVAFGGLITYLRAVSPARRPKQLLEIIEASIAALNVGAQALHEEMRGRQVSEPRRKRTRNAH
jgi:hypothetical protein